MVSPGHPILAVVLVLFVYPCAVRRRCRLVLPSTLTMDNPGESASGPLGGDVRQGGGVAWAAAKTDRMYYVILHAPLATGPRHMSSPQLLPPLLSITLRASSDTHTHTPPWASSPPAHPLSFTRSTHPWASTQTTSLSNPPRSCSRSEPSPSPV